jgi:hypothetical protein
LEDGGGQQQHRRGGSKLGGSGAVHLAKERARKRAPAKTKNQLSGNEGGGYSVYGGGGYGWGGGVDGGMDDEGDSRWKV